MAEESVKPVPAPSQAAKAAPSKYRIHALLAHRKSHIDIIDGRRVNLTGKDITITRTPTEDNPETEVFIPGATEAELDKYFARGHQDLLIKIS